MTGIYFAIAAGACLGLSVTRGMPSPLQALFLSVGVSLSIAASRAQ